MSEPLAGKTLVVTGASGQVGWGIAHAALEAGANVVLPVRGGPSRDALAAELESERASVVAVDFSDEAGMAAMRDAALKRFGAIDHVFSPLGGWWQKGASLEQPASELRGLLGVYVEAQWMLVKTLAPALRSSRGSYTFITGAAGEQAFIKGAGLQVVAVSAQHALSRVLRHELADEPFRVNEIRISRRIEREPGRNVTPARVAGAALLEAASTKLTGKLFRYEGKQLEPDERGA